MPATKAQAERFAMAIHHAIKVRDWNQKAFANAAGLTDSKVSRWLDEQRWHDGSCAVKSEDLVKLRDNERLPLFFRQTCEAIVEEMIGRGPVNPPEHCSSYDLGFDRELDADHDNRLTDRDALIWSDRATRVLRMVSEVGGRR